MHIFGESSLPSHKTTRKQCVGVVINKRFFVCFVLLLLLLLLVIYLFFYLFFVVVFCFV